MPFIGGEYRHPVELKSTLADRLERQARIAHAAVADSRSGGRPVSPAELEASADMLEQAAIIIRRLEGLVPVHAMQAEASRQ